MDQSNPVGRYTRVAFLDTVTYMQGAYLETRVNIKEILYKRLLVERRGQLCRYASAIGTYSGNVTNHRDLDTVKCVFRTAIDVLLGPYEYRLWPPSPTLTRVGPLFRPPGSLRDAMVPSSAAQDIA